MTERRVSQRTGNTETCQTELEGEMEGGRRGRKSRRERRKKAGTTEQMD